MSDKEKEEEKEMEKIRIEIWKAVEESDYKWRTVKGVAAEIKCPPETVEKLVFSSDSTSIITSTIPSTTGERLFTTRNHYRKRSTPWDRFKSAVINEVQT